MVQAARSGRQNIAEGSRAAASSSQTELRLTNVARSSLEELLLDDEDFLRHRHLPQWPPDSPEASAVRRVARTLRRDPPPCPACGSLMAVRMAKAGAQAGRQFWGCTRYPDCRGTAPV